MCSRGRRASGSGSCKKSSASSRRLRSSSCSWNSGNHSKFNGRSSRREICSRSSCSRSNGSSSNRSSSSSNSSGSSRCISSSSLSSSRIRRSSRSSSPFGSTSSNPTRKPAAAHSRPQQLPFPHLEAPCQTPRCSYGANSPQPPLGHVGHFQGSYTCLWEHTRQPGGIPGREVHVLYWKMAKSGNTGSLEGYRQYGQLWYSLRSYLKQWDSLLARPGRSLTADMMLHLDRWRGLFVELKQCMRIVPAVCAVGGLARRSTRSRGEAEWLGTKPPLGTAPEYLACKAASNEEQGCLWSWERDGAICDQGKVKSSSTTTKRCLGDFVPTCFCYTMPICFQGCRQKQASLLVSGVKGCCRV